MNGPRVLRVLAAIAIALSALYVLYLAGANLLVKTNLLRSIMNDGPERTHIAYRDAYTLWPGRVHVTGLRINDRDFNAEWLIALDEGVARIGLFDLMRREFHTSFLRGSGLVIRIRTRLPAEKATPRWLSFLPPIPEFPEPPVQPAGERPARPDPSEVWTVRLDGVAVDDVREIWVDEYRFAGTAHLTGGLHLVPRRMLEVTPADLRVQDGVMQYRNLTAAGKLEGRLMTRVDECDLRGMKGGDVLRFMTGNGRVEGRIEGAEVLDEILGIAPHVRFRKGSGSLTAELSLDHGRGVGHLDFSIMGIQAATEGLTLDGHAEGSMRLSSLDLNRSLADFSGSTLRLRDIVVTKPDGATRPWWLRLKIGQGRLTTDSPRLFRARLSATARDARPLYRLLNTGLPHWAEGMLELESMSTQADVALGVAYIEVEDLRAEGEKYVVEGRFRRRGTQSHGLFLVSRGRLDLAAEIVGGRTQLKMFRSERWFRERAASF